MTKLKDIPIDELRTMIGCRVKSTATGTEGVLVSVSDEEDREDFVIGIDWDNGNISRLVWHCWTDKVVKLEV